MGFTAATPNTIENNQTEMKTRKITPLLAALALGQITSSPAADATPKSVPAKMTTRWGKTVTPENVWPEYPRPQFERKEWKNLNGLWDYAITAKAAAAPTEWQGKILVPFAVEAALSGVGKALTPEQTLWYRRSFDAKKPGGRRVLLNFEAVDYHTTVWVNDQPVGEHIGGNTAFSFDITEALRDGANQLLVRVWDETGSTQLRGKQTLNPQGIWYTAVSGIWQTVWLEEVPAMRLADVKIVTKIHPAVIILKPTLAGAGGESKVRVTATFGGKTMGNATGAGELKLPLADAKLWSPSQPNLYDLRLELLDAKGNVVDSVKSYAGLREVGRKQDAQGHWRFTLNGEEIFHWGPLDQGWWPDGLLTPPSDAAMRFDVDFLKAAGFNMIRKHIKVEPRRYYAYCDRVGMLLWQDQVSANGSRGGQEVSPKWTRMAQNPTDAVWTDAAHAQWLKEFKAMIDQLHNAPCIVVWDPYNEAWGQHRTMEVGQWAMEYDPTRPINIASGGNFWPVGQIADAHRYPDPGFPFEQARFHDYVKVVGEFGGHGWPVPGHLWDESKRNWGYGGLPQTKEEYQARYEKSVKVLAELKAKGIAAGVYTQTTDVEGEINGLLTYDRAVEKIPAKKLAEISQALEVEAKR